MCYQEEQRIDGLPPFSLPKNKADASSISPVIVEEEKKSKKVRCHDC